MNDNIEDNINQNIDLEEQLPDYHIEQFWYNLKISMKNFYSENKRESRNLNKWSDTLNRLQKAGKYRNIEKKIMDYITCYGLDIIKSGSEYHLSILHTNIKRWNNLTTSYKIFSNSRYKNLFYTCIEISYCLSKSNIDFKEIFEDIELIVINNNIEELLNIGISFNKPSIIDKLLNYDKELVLETLKSNNQHFKNININTLTSKNIMKLSKK